MFSEKNYLSPHLSEGHGHLPGPAPTPRLQIECEVATSLATLTEVSERLALHSPDRSLVGYAAIAVAEFNCGNIEHCKAAINAGVALLVPNESLLRPSVNYLLPAALRCGQTEQAKQICDYVCLHGEKIEVIHNRLKHFTELTAVLCQEQAFDLAERAFDSAWVSIQAPIHRRHLSEVTDQLFRLIPGQQSVPRDAELFIRNRMRALLLEPSQAGIEHLKKHVSKLPSNDEALCKAAADILQDSFEILEQPIGMSWFAGPIVMAQFLGETESCGAKIREFAYGVRNTAVAYLFTLPEKLREICAVNAGIERMVARTQGASAQKFALELFVLGNALPSLFILPVTVGPNLPDEFVLQALTESYARHLRSAPDAGIIGHAICSEWRSTKRYVDHYGTDQQKAIFAAAVPICFNKAGFAQDTILESSEATEVLDEITFTRVPTREQLIALQAAEEYRDEGEARFRIISDILEQKDLKALSEAVRELLSREDEQVFDSFAEEWNRANGRLDHLIMEVWAEKAQVPASAEERALLTQICEIIIEVPAHIRGGVNGERELEALCDDLISAVRILAESGRARDARLIIDEFRSSDDTEGRAALLLVLMANAQTTASEATIAAESFKEFENVFSRLIAHEDSDGTELFYLPVIEQAKVTLRYGLPLARRLFGESPALTSAISARANDPVALKLLTDEILPALRQQLSDLRNGSSTVDTSILGTVSEHLSGGVLALSKLVAELDTRQPVSLTIDSRSHAGRW